MKVTGKCGSVKVRLIPAPRGTGICAARAPTKLLKAAGVQDVFSMAAGKTKSMGNFIKATWFALRKTYQYLTPDLWTQTKFEKTPFEIHGDFLKESQKPHQVKKVDRR